MIVDIGYIIDNFSEIIPYTLNGTDDYGFSGVGVTQNISGVVEISSLKDAINPGSAVLYTRADVVIGGGIDWLGGKYRIEAKVEDYKYDLMEIK